MTDPFMEHLIEFFQDLDVLAPADPPSTRRALRKLPLTEQSLIVDAGCGTGRQTRQLLDETRSQIVAVDLEPTFLPALGQWSASHGSRDRLRLASADMLALPLADASVDLIYSEGAIYSVGVAAGLEAWLPLLKAGGYVCISDAAYTVDDPPTPVRQFWEAEYAGMGSPDHLRRQAIDTGFEIMDEFWMPSAGWESYYSPIERRIEQLAPRWDADTSTQAVLNSLRDEVKLYQEYGGTYGYYFLVLQKAAE